MASKLPISPIGQEEISFRPGAGSCVLSHAPEEQESWTKRLTAVDKWSILAGVRFILASIVAINHLGDYTSLGHLSFIPRFGAFEAILGFLLISGYSISASFARQPRGFVWRRILRLYPIYLAAMVASYLACLLLRHQPPPLGSWVINALFLNQLVTTDSLVGQAWSLSLEFWLYCLMPLLARLSSSWLRVIIFGSFGCYVVYTILRTLAHMPYYSGVGYGGNLLLLCFIWVAGVRLARLNGEQKAALRDVRTIFGCHIGLAVAIQFGSRLKHAAVTLFLAHDLTTYAMQSLTLVFVYFTFKYLVIQNRAAVHRSWVMRFLGDISYPLYLLHSALFEVLTHFGVRSPVLLYSLALLVSATLYWLLDVYSKRRHQQIGTT